MEVVKPVATIKDRLKEAMMLRGKRSCDLSRETGIERSSISHYLSGLVEPKQDRVYLLAQALNVNEAWLFGYDVPIDRLSQSKATDLHILDEDQKPSMIVEIVKNLPHMSSHQLIAIYNVIKAMTEDQNNG